MVFDSTMASKPLPLNVTELPQNSLKDSTLFIMLAVVKCEADGMIRQS